MERTRIKYRKTPDGTILINAVRGVARRLKEISKNYKNKNREVVIY